MVIWKAGEEDGERVRKEEEVVGEVKGVVEDPEAPIEVLGMMARGEESHRSLLRYQKMWMLQSPKNEFCTISNTTCTTKIVREM